MSIDKPLTAEDQKDMAGLLAYANLTRTKNLAGILFGVSLGLFYVDYLYRVSGRWNYGYRALFQAHAVLGIVTCLFFLSYFALKAASPKEIKWFQKLYEITFAFFVLMISAVVSGWIDQHIHGQITVYIIACFTVAGIYYHKPKLTVLLYALSYILFVTLLNIAPISPAIRQVNEVNAGLMVVLACFISIVLYKLMQRDLLYRYSLEATVQERTQDLQRYNDLLKQEIGERQRAEFELDHFFAASPDILCILDFEGNIKRTNPALTQILGYSRVELETTSIVKLIHPEDVTAVRNEVDRVLQEKQAVLKMEIRCKSEQGEYKWLEWLAVLVPDSQRIFAVARDITERIRASEKVFRLASIVESSHDGIIGLSLDGVILDWNSAAKRICGYAEPEILGEPISKLVAGEKHKDLEQIFEQVFAGEEISLFETQWVRNDGSPVDVALTVFPIGDVNAGILGYSIIVVELTEKKRLEVELARLDRLNVVGEMAACICHEVRNPMTTIKGFLQFTRDKQDNKGQEYFDIMIEELNRANAILSEFLSISRNKVTIFELCNINEIITVILPLIQAEALRNDKVIAVELNEVPDLQLDAMEIRQLVLNLVRNGLEAMEPGGKLMIKTFADQDEVALTVADEGGGIEPQVLAKLGTPFFSTKKDGTGLGLAVCESIITRHKGRLEVVSSPEGSTFCVYLNPQVLNKAGVA